MHTMPYDLFTQFNEHTNNSNILYYLKKSHIENVKVKK